ncbi:MAG: hypothetical protein OEU32_14680 [Acidimicrobiia bacterium]|nr:hypothetical protein [Acidimicrobiia bacterium]
MDVRTWIMADLMTLATRLDRGVLECIPPDRRIERVDDGGIAPTYVLWHTARHHDVAVNRILRGAGEVVEGWTDRVGARGDLWRGLAEAEDTELVTELDPEAVGLYLLAVAVSTRDWVETADLAVLDTTPDSGAALAALGTPEDRFDWLYAMWDAKPATFFLQWEAIGHGYNHLGELVSIRNRMGLSPF